MKDNKDSDTKASDASVQSVQDPSELEAILLVVEQEYEIEKDLNLALEKTEEDEDWFENPEVLKIIRRKNQFKKEFSLQPEEMRIIIQAKKDKNPESKLDCHVFGKDENEKLQQFLKDLIANDNYIGKRVQIVFEFSEGLAHWSAADICIKENEIQIIHFDTLYVNPDEDKFKTLGGKNGSKLASMLEAIESSKPINMVDAYSDIRLKNKPAQRIGLQIDAKSCSIFALSSALRMSKISDLHTMVSDQVVMSKERSEHNLARYTVETKKFPSKLYKNVQSSSAVEHLNDDSNKILTGKKSNALSLQEYTEKRSHSVKTLDKETEKETIKKQNLGIYYTRKHYKDIVKNKNDAGKPENDKKAFFDSVVSREVGAEKDKPEEKGKELIKSTTLKK